MNTAEPFSYNCWGLLGPEFLPNSRRTRTLGLGATVRLFNDLAVPGLGGVWYGKQLLLATLGLIVAEQARSRDTKVQNIEVANAIEALACWLAFKKNGWNSDPRLRGKSKLQGKDNDFSFKRVRQRNFYVTQPMRMATVQALPALGLAEADGSRFSAFTCTEAGKSFVEDACKAYRPNKRSVIDQLLQWVTGNSGPAATDALGDALSPLTALSADAGKSLRERLIQGGREDTEDRQRRCKALAWVEEIRNRPEKPGWDVKPLAIDECHWHDLIAGARLFAARDAAIAVLDAMEAHIGNKTGDPSHALPAVPPELEQPLNELRAAASFFLDCRHSDRIANAFCQECVNDKPAEVLRALVKRDEKVLRLLGDDIKPGPAFRGSAWVAAEAEADVNADLDDPAAAGDLPLPKGISYRMRNLYLLSLDIDGKLDEYLNPNQNGAKA